MLIKYLTLFSGINHLVFSIILLTKKTPHKKANSILGVTFLLMTCYSFVIYFLYYALSIESREMLAHYIPLDYILQMLMGPAIFIYLKSILVENFRVRAFKFWLHLIPAVPAITFIAYFMNLDTEVRVDLMLQNFNKSIWQTEVLNGIFFLQMTSYLVICYNIVRKQLKSTRKVIIENIQFDIHWLRTYFAIDIAIMIIAAPIIIILASEEANLIVSLSAMNIQFVYIFIISNWKTGVFPTEVVAGKKNKNKNLIIEKDVLEAYALKLQDYFEQDQPYLEDNCSLQNISIALKIPTHHLSHVLNSHLKQSFAEFVNQYRVEFAKEYLTSKDSKMLTMEAIALNCGYGSKASFNRSFKKLTGKTPSEYRNKMN